MKMTVRTQLMPGVWLSAVQTRKLKNSFWSALLLTPLQPETASMTALLPKVLRCGTARYPDRQQLAAALDNLYGGRIEPLVLKLGEVQAAGFVASFLDDAYALDNTAVSRWGAELLGDVLVRPATRNGRLRSDYADREKENLVSEILAQKNDKRQYASLRLAEEMCRGERYATDCLGSAESAQAIRGSKLDQYYRKLLQESRIELFYCGALSSEQVGQMWMESLMGIPRKGDFLLPAAQTDVRPQQIREVAEHLPVNQTKLAIGFRTQTGLDDPLYPALMVANALLGGSPASKLFQTVREKRSLCYYASSGLDKHKALLTIHTGVSKEHADEAKATILEQVNALQNGNYTSGDLEAARNCVVNQLISAGDDDFGLFRFCLDQTLSETPVSLREQIALVREVTLQDVASALARLECDTIYLLTDGPAKEDENGTA